MDATSFSLFAQTAPGLEALALEELKELGIQSRAIPGGVAWEGGWRSLVESNLHLRTASRVLAEVASFPARALGELERKAGLVDWDRHLPAGPVALRVSASRSRLYHEGAISERILTAIGRPEPEDGATPSLLVVRVHRDRVTIRLDGSGEHLHRRGYRTDVGGAPIRENLAAAALLASGWDESSPFLDPFAGSGTLAIEAALRARRIPPGLASPGLRPRGWAFERWPGFDAALLDRVCEDARARVLPTSAAPIFASDRDREVVEAAVRNTGRAGLEGSVEWSVATFTSAPLPPEPGWIVTNPPYGGRLGTRKRLRALYAALGRTIHEGWAGWNVAFLGSDPVLAAATGVPMDEGLRTRSGGTEIRLWVTRSGPRPPTPPSGP